MNLATSQFPGGAPGAEPVFVQASGVEPDRLPKVRHYLRIAMRRRYVILGAAAACLLLGLVATLLMTPQYTSSTTLEISRESNQVTEFQGVERDTNIADQEFYQTQYSLLQSRSLSERVANQLKLVDDPKFFALFGISSDDPAFELENGRYPVKGRVVRQRVAGEVLRKNVTVSPTRLSRLVSVAVTSSDPEFSASVANAWAENFIQTNLERKIQATSYGRNLLQRQLGQLKEKLDESQRLLVGYALAERIINLPTQSVDGKTTSERSIVADDLAALNASLAQATSDRIQAEARYNQAGKSGSSAEALRNTAINGLRQRRAELAAEYQQMMTQFEPEYPAARAIQSQIDQLDRSIAREESRVSSSILADYRQAQAREQALQTKVEQLKVNYLDLRRRSIQYNVYQQEVDTNRALYDAVLQRFKEIGVAGGVGINNVSVVDPAQVPENPSSPRLMVNVLLSLLAGLALGAFLAFILEQIDEAITEPDEVVRRINVPLLGSVPKLETGSPMEALLDRKSDLFDAYLSIQTNLGFTTEHGVPRAMAVTSTRPAEGKSTTALALATTLARAHRKVILVDGDMRSPSIHHLGKVGHEFGLSNFLSGRDDIEALTFPMADLGITAMSAGPIPPNAAELLTGHRFTQLIERLVESYDHVIIDCPPVMGLADALLIANRVEGVVYAIEANSIRASLVKSALARLINANVRVFGAVLTKFEASKAHYGYDYGYGYGRDQRAEKKTALQT